MDYLKELSIKLGGKIKRQEIHNANFREKSYKRLIIKSHQGFKLQIDDYGDICLVGIKVNSALALSINNPDKVFSFNKPIKLEDIPYKVFVSDVDNYSFTNKTHFKDFWMEFGDKIKALKLLHNESVFFYNNYIFFALSSNRKLLPIIYDIINLISSHNKIFRKENRNVILIKNIPENLRSLALLLKKWSISDDDLRNQLVAEISQQQKEKLINTVSPLIKDINDFLDSFKERPLTE